MKNKSTFINLYAEWGHYLETRFGNKGMWNLAETFYIAEKEKCDKQSISLGELQAIVSIRNTYQHTPSFLEIKPKALVFLRQLVNTFCNKASDIAVPKQDIYIGGLGSSVKEVIKEMSKSLFTHVPIIEKQKFYGVFSENTLLKLEASNKVLDKLKIEDIKSVLKDTQDTDDYKFLSTQASFYEVYQLFQDYIDKGKRLGVIFLTKDGKESGDIKGLITAWDLHKGLD